MTIYSSRYASIEVPDLSITDYVLRGLAARAEQPVLTCGVTGRSLTGAALEAQIRALAGGIAARWPGQTIALMAPNMPEFAVVFHGVAYAGGTITTINPAYTASEVTHQLMDASATVLITIPDFLATAQAGSRGTDVHEIIVIGEAEGATPLADVMAAPLGAQVPVDLKHHTLVLPYSSGTTGLPKGVMLSHHNLVANLVQTAVAHPIDPHGTTIAVLPYFHIYGMQVMMNFYLAEAGHVVTLPRFELEPFLRLVQDHKMARLYLVPPIMIALARHPVVDQFDLSAVRTVMSAAAPMGADLSEAVATRLGCAVMQGYGMTETSPVAFIGSESERRHGASGELVPLTEARLYDHAAQTDAEQGAEGELWVRGPQIMQGYLGRPDATQDSIDKDGWLRTGDIGRIEDDGYLYIVDRLKELIKYKGFQVAPAELEAVLMSHPAIADVAVVGAPDDEAGELPVAFIVVADGAEADLGAVQAYVAERLAGYKQIHRLIEIDVIPKSASGKILRRLLRDQL